MGADKLLLKFKEKEGQEKPRYGRKPRQEVPVRRVCAIEISITYYQGGEV